MRRRRVSWKHWGSVCRLAPGQGGGEMWPTGRAARWGMHRRGGICGFSVVVAVIALVAGSVVLAVSPPATAAPPVEGSTIRASVTSTGGQASGSAPAVSRDGRYVAFVSDSSALVSPNPHGYSMVFLRDLVTNTTIVVSGVGGGVANQSSGSPAITADGGLVFFDSAASNLVPGDTNAKRDVFVWERASGAISLVSTASGGANGDSFSPSVSDDGDRVVFTSSASNLVAVDRNGGHQDVFLHDRSAGTFTLVDSNCCSGFINGELGFSPQAALAHAGRQAISADGRYVVWVGHEYRGALSSDHCSGSYDHMDPFVYDSVTGTTTRLGPTGVIGCWTQAWGTSSAVGVNTPSITPDGSLIGFIDTGQNLRRYGTGGQDLGTIDLPATNAPLSDPWFSTSGARLVLWSAASNLVSGDTNGRDDAFSFDVGAGWFVPVSVNATRAFSTSFPSSPATGSNWPALSGDGRQVVFASLAGDLVTGDTNTAADVFARGLPAVAPMGAALSSREVIGGSNPSELCVCGVRSHADPVLTATGSLWETQVDLAVPGPGFGLAVSRTYDSQLASETGSFGYGWTSSYGMRVAIDSGTGIATVRQENGSEVTFAEIGSAWRPTAPRMLATLVEDADGSFTFTRRGRDVFEFDATGRLTALVDLNGNVTTVSYPSSTSMVVTDAAGRTLTFTLASGRVVSVTDPSTPARTVAYDYDVDGDLVKVTDVANGTWLFGYTAGHLLTSVTSPRQAAESPPARVVNTFDGQGRVVSQTDELNGETTFDYTTTPGSVVITDPAGRVTIERYEQGLLVEETKGAGSPQAATWSYEYDPVTLGVSSVTDPSQRVTSFTFDSNGNQLTATDPLGRTVTATYNSLNEPLTVTDPAGVTTTFTYDAAGNPLTAVTPLVGSSPLQTQTVTYRYEDPAHPGKVTSMIDPRNQTWAYTYDPYGNQASATDPLGNRTTWTYNIIGWPTTMVSPRGNVAGADPATFTTRFDDYSAHGALEHVTDPLGHGSGSTYDGDGNLLTSTDAENQITTYIYDDADRLVTVDRPGTTADLGTEYWPDGSMRTQIDGAGARTGYAYDSLGRLATVTDPLGRVTTYGYDLTGNLTSRQDPGGNCAASPRVACTSYGYDVANQLKTVAYSDGVTPNVTNVIYDANGRRTSLVAANGTSTWTWDSLGRLTGSSDPNTGTTGYGWDLAGNLTSIAYPGTPARTVTRTYDDVGRFTSVNDGSGNVTTFGYNQDGAWADTTFPGGQVRDVYGLDNANRVMSTTMSNGATTLASLTYGRANDNQLISVNQTGLPGAVSETFDYSPINQLTERNDTPTWTYDPADNLTRTAAGAQQGFDAANQLCYSSPTTTGTCSTPPADATGYEYDSRGNRTTETSPGGDVREFGYDGANRLTTLTSTLASDDGRYVAIEPALIADTRNGTGACTPTPCAPIPAGGNIRVQVAGHGGVPATGASTAVVHVSVPAPPTNGTFKINEVGTGQRAAATLHLVAGETTNIVTIARLDATGGINLSATVPAEAIVSVTGWFTDSSGTATAGFTTLDPSRLVDTATGVGQCTPGPCARLGAGTTTTIQVTGRSGVPSTGVSAVAVQLQVRNGGTVGGYVSVDPTGIAGSRYTWAPNERAGGLVIAQLDAAGTLTIYASAAVDVIIDVVGWFGPNGNSTFAPIEPVRVLHTTSGIGECSPSPCAQIPAGGSLQVRVAETAAVPTQDPAAVTLSITATSPAGTGSLQVRSNGIDPPAASLTTNKPGKSINSVVVVRPDSNGWITLQATGANMRVVIDATGWFEPIPKPQEWTYTYNGDSLRTTRTAPDSTTSAFAWDKASGLPLLLTETTGSNRTTYIYGPSGLPVEQINPDGTILYLHHDQLGSTRLLTNPNGTIAGTATYDAYGTPTTTGTVSRLGYAGQYTDPGTSLQYLRARYYDPLAGQFLTRDPLVAQTREPYGYTGNNPINRTDPMGMDWGPIGWAADQVSDLCIDTGGNDSCDTIAEQHPGGTQQIVDFAGGALQVNPITAPLPLDLEAHGVNTSSGSASVGRFSMAAFQTGFGWSNVPIAALNTGSGVTNAFSACLGINGAHCGGSAFASVVGFQSIYGNMFGLPFVSNFYNGLSNFMGAVPWGEGDC